MTTFVYLFDLYRSPAFRYWQFHASDISLAKYSVKLIYYFVQDIYLFNLSSALSDLRKIQAGNRCCKSWTKVNVFFQKKNPLSVPRANRSLLTLVIYWREGRVFSHSDHTFSSQLKHQLLMSWYFFGFFSWFFCAKYLDSWDVSVFKIRGCM